MKTTVCDMHIHSNCSDGSVAPEELAIIAKESGIAAIALCDHNTVSGLKRFLKASKEVGIIGVPGIEISCDHNGNEVHMLGLFVGEEDYTELDAFLSEINNRKTESNRVLTANLNSAGYDITYERVLTLANGNIPNRVHFGLALAEKGYVRDVKDAFTTLLSDNAGYYVPAQKLNALEVVEFLRSLQAVPVLAHPFLNLSQEELLEFIPKAMERGLQGMECFYSKFTKEQTEKAVEIANSFGLFQSGGSDFHGSNKPDIKMGFGLGDLEIPLSVYESLKNAYASNCNS